jgi:hypothetical protein
MDIQERFLRGRSDSGRAKTGNSISEPNQTLRGHGGTWGNGFGPKKLSRGHQADF